MSDGPRKQGQPWVLPVYGFLVGALLGLLVGLLAWQLLAQHSEQICVALTAGGTRCTGGTYPDGWTYAGGAVGAAAGLAVAGAHRLRSRK